MMSRRNVGWAILAWTLVSWGGRVGLLGQAPATDVGSWIRIGGSLLVGILAGWALISGRFARPAVLVFALWTAAIWVRSLWVVWSQPNTLGFRLVHTALAAGWVVLIWAAQRVTASRPGIPTGAPGGSI
ncbi:MAG: hypothetical protein OEX04_12440 [Acidimicrobiia bacterium]|nr:hypothetical protein [Acidimicrobiia bacterium]MDH4308276.1 hypothetical protein [Acidimicrobiia bacterium]